MLAQALNVGLLLTEDKEILDLRQRENFKKDPVFGKLSIKQWMELSHT
jgi:hypothetical protein